MRASRVSRSSQSSLEWINNPLFMIAPLQQGDEKKCSWYSVINCIRLNTPELAHKFTQEVADRIMEDYIMKHPRDAFRFLKDKWFDVKLVPLNFESAKIRMKKGSAVVCRRKYNKNWWNDILDWDWEANGSKPIDIDVGRSGHFFVLMAEGEKYRAWDSNTRMTYRVDLEYFYKEGVIWKEFFQIR